MFALLMLFLCVVLHDMSLGKSLQLLCILTLGMLMIVRVELSTMSGCKVC